MSSPQKLPKNIENALTKISDFILDNNYQFFTDILPGQEVEGILAVDLIAFLRLLRNTIKISIDDARDLASEYEFKAGEHDTRYISLEELNDDLLTVMLDAPKKKKM